MAGFWQHTCIHVKIYTCTMYYRYYRSMCIMEYRNTYILKYSTTSKKVVEGKPLSPNPSPRIVLAKIVETFFFYEREHCMDLFVMLCCDVKQMKSPCPAPPGLTRRGTEICPLLQNDTFLQNSNKIGNSVVFFLWKWPSGNGEDISHLIVIGSRRLHSLKPLSHKTCNVFVLQFKATR